MTTATDWLCERDLAFRCAWSDMDGVTDAERPGAVQWRGHLEREADRAYAAHQTRELIARLVAANITTEAEARATFALAEDFRNPRCLEAQKQLHAWIKQLS